MPKQLAQVFRLLRQGKHVCRDDGAVFRDLERHEGRYRVVFQALGYQLIRHDRGFYYFQGDNTLPTVRLQAVTLFVLILFQELEEKKFQEPDRAWEKLLTSRIFHVDELPHFATARRRDLMQSVGVSRIASTEKRGDAYRARNHRAQATADAPSYCPPSGGDRVACARHRGRGNGGYRGTLRRCFCDVLPGQALAGVCGVFRSGVVVLP